MRIKLLKWYIHSYINSIEFEEHKCYNQIMDGTYSCDYCYPPCKKCGRDTAMWDVHCTKKYCELECT